MIAINYYIVRNVNKIESVQRRFTKRIPSVSHLSYRDRLRLFVFVSDAKSFIKLTARCCLNCMLFNADCQDLLKRFLTANPDRRISLYQAMHHPWLAEGDTKIHNTWDCYTLAYIRTRPILILI